MAPETLVLESGSWEGGQRFWRFSHWPSAHDNTERSRIVTQDVEDVSQRAASALTRLAGRTVVIAGAAGFLPSYLVDAIAHANDALLERAVPSDLPRQLRRRASKDRLAHLRRPRRLRSCSERYLEGRGGSMSASTTSFTEPASRPRRGTGATRSRRSTSTSRHARPARPRARARRARASSISARARSTATRHPSEIPTTEEYWGHVSATGPRAPYDESKRLGGDSMHDVPPTPRDRPSWSIRPFNVYGPRLRLDDGRVVPDFIGDALGGLSIRLLQRRSRDPELLLRRGLRIGAAAPPRRRNPGEAYNVGNDDEVTIRDVAELAVGAPRSSWTSSTTAERRSRVPRRQSLSPLPGSDEDEGAIVGAGRPARGRVSGTYDLLPRDGGSMKVAVVGCGYVGLVTGAGLASVGHASPVSRRTARRAAIAAGRPPFYEPGLPELLREPSNRAFRVAADVHRSRGDAEVVFLAVQTRRAKTEPSTSRTSRIRHVQLARDARGTRPTAARRRGPQHRRPGDDGAGRRPRLADARRPLRRIRSSSAKVGGAGLPRAGPDRRRLPLAWAGQLLARLYAPLEAPVVSPRRRPPSSRSTPRTPSSRR